MYFEFVDSFLSAPWPAVLAKADVRRFSRPAPLCGIACLAPWPPKVHRGRLNKPFLIARSFSDTSVEAPVFRLRACAGTDPRTFEFFLRLELSGFA
jgi:hypothetical protein